MGNAFLLSAACLNGCAFVLCFILKPSRRSEIVLRAVWISVTLLLCACFGMLIYYLLGDCFEYRYVFGHSQIGQAVVYKISALWAGQEGSFLLWSVVLALMGFPLLLEKNKTTNCAFGIYGVICFCVIVMCCVSQPFAMQSKIPADGSGIAEALKDPWMVVHPPLVFVAYSAMAVLAAKSVAISDKQSQLQLDRINKLTRISWVVLGLGIFTGSIWAYRALGWGGYWAWDPIENAALVPWLVLCTALHRKNDISRTRCILPFAIACFGTFLARSGILKDSSAHAYADGNILISIILLALLLVAASLIIIKTIKSQKNNKKYNIKELNGIFKDKRRVFAAAVYAYAALIFIGTVIPLISKLNTSIEYYTAISIAFAMIYSVLLLAWDWEALKKKNLWMMVLSTLLVIGAVLKTGTDRLGYLLLLWICLMPLSLWIVSGFKTQSWRYYIPHIGMTLLILGVILSSGISGETFALIQPGGTSANIGGTVIALKDLLGKDVIIISTLAGDYIVQPSGAVALPDGSIAIPLIVKPMILAFWFGGFAVILSPLISAVIQKVLSSNQRKRSCCDQGKALADSGIESGDDLVTAVIIK